MIPVLVSLGASAAITWVIARRYYQKQTADLEQELNRLYERLTEVYRLEDARDLSLNELEEVILERGYPTPFGIVPEECPDCGAGTDTRGGSPIGPDGDRYPWMETYCTNPDCNWSR